MNVIIDDSDVLRNVNYNDVLSFLRLRGWQQSFFKAGEVAIYRKQHGDSRRELTVPLASDFLDYDQAVAHILEVLSDTEHLSQLQLLTDIQNLKADIIRVRVNDASFEDGSLPAEAGSRLVENAIEMVMAAASSADRPRAVYSSRRSDKVVQFMKGVRLGQTERGSYIVTLKTPVPPTLVESGGQMGLPPELDEPYERIVTKTLSQALTSTQEAIAASSASGELKPFQEAVNLGVSANLLDSIASLVRDTGATETNINLTWSPTRVPAEPIPSQFTFSREDESLIKEASRRLRENNPRPDQTVQGLVRRLERTDEEGPRTITVFAKMDGIMRSIRVDLSPDDYSLAMKAHGDWLSVSVVGELTKEGKYYRMRSPASFDLFSSAEVDDSPDLEESINAQDDQI